MTDIVTIEQAREVASKCAAELGFEVQSALNLAAIWFDFRLPNEMTERELYIYIETALSPIVDDEWYATDAAENG